MIVISNNEQRSSSCEYGTVGWAIAMSKCMSLPSCWVVPVREKKPAEGPIIQVVDGGRFSRSRTKEVA